MRVLQPDEDGFVLPIGQPADTPGLTSRLKSVSGAANAPELFVEVLADEVRRVAETNPAVGRGLLINMLPRGSIKPEASESIRLLSGPDPEHQTFLYVPADDEQAEMYGPTVVSGGTIMSGFTVKPL